MSKSTNKPVTKTATKDMFAAKKIGTTLQVTYARKVYSKKVTADEYKTLENKIKLYNKKPSDTLKNTIIKLMTPEATKKATAKENVKAAVKGIKKQVKKETKKKETVEQKDFLTLLDEFLAGDEDGQKVEKLQAILNKHKKVEETKPHVEAKETEKPRPGESYRRY